MKKSHRWKPRQEPGGRNWSIGHGECVDYWLVFPYPFHGTRVDWDLPYQSSIKNVPLQVCPQINRAEAIARLRFPPPRWPHLVSHWQKVNNIRRKYFDSYLWRSSVCWRTEGCSHHDRPGSRRNTWDKGWAITLKFLFQVTYFCWSLKAPCGFKIVLLSEE